MVLEAYSRFCGKLGHGYRAVVEDPPAGTHHYCLRDGAYLAPTKGTIQISPRLELANGTSISIDQIILQTVVSKWLGPISAWKPHLEAAAEVGFNMIHFTPLQRRGLSNSPYSIYDHLDFSPDLTEDASESGAEAVAATLEWMYRKGLLSLTDIVWNHIACNSPYINDHPEIGYNLENAKHLQVAFDLDECLLRFSNELSSYDLSPTIESEADVLRIMTVFRQQVLPKEALWEYFVVNVSRALMDLELVFRRTAIVSPTSKKAGEPVPRIGHLAEAMTDDQEFSRNSHRMDIDLVAEYFRPQIDEYRACPNERDRSLLLSRVLAEYRQALDQLNYARYKLYDEHVQEIVQNLTTRIVYERVAEHGPTMGPITPTSPLVATYFTRVGRRAFANNGWIWNADPLVNFAEAPGLAYLRREVIVWGDCVKLRYGQSPEDSPWLWDYMTRYTQLMARLFHGFRIDNCHSTPLHVAEYLLGKAREVRPDLYVCAELFTGSEERDMLFVCRLGLHSLIREAMSAWNVAELARITARYGGHPMGSVLGVEEEWWPEAHALYMDCTHDNETPMQKRTAEDALPNTAIVTMSMAAIGSTRGYDELTPRHLNLVSEARLYPLPVLSTGLWQGMTFSGLFPDSALILARKMLNQVHHIICSEQMTEIRVTHEDDVIMIDRHNPFTMTGLLLVARTAFSPPTPSPIRNPLDGSTIGLECLDPRVTMDKYELEPLFSAHLRVIGPTLESDTFIPTTPVAVEISRTPMLENMAPPAADQNSTALKLQDFAPGSMVIFRKRPLFPIPPVLSEWPALSEAKAIIDQLDWSELNILLYRCAAEENDGSRQIGTYDLPGYGALAYSGLQGFYSVIKKLQASKSPWHPLIDNILKGDWALEYVCTRVVRKNHPNLSRLATAVKDVMGCIMLTTAWMKPRLFVHVIKGLYEASVASALQRMSDFVRHGGGVVRELALTSVQLIGAVSSTGLHLLEGESPSMSAGLPHFSTHHMRCWGRDIFVSLPGLMVLTGRWEDARRHLVAFAGCYYRGLLPNLLDSGRRPRYNARDATWWFLRALRFYCERAPEGREILDTPIPLRFPNDIYVDFDDPSIFTRTIPLGEIIQKIMQAHAEGIQFREWNAGPALDPMMTDKGFEIDIRLDRATGLVHGGNAHNCGTWMDKMGEAERAGNKGVPATPRDGAAIELTALLYSTLEWLAEANPTGLRGVYLSGDNRELSYAEWHELIRTNFERLYFIPEDPKADHQYCLDPALVGARGIYKDTVGATASRCDYQLRPNMVLAMHIAPGLFDAAHARLALRAAEQHLCGPLGMKTLSPSDPSYRPNYDNSNDSDDASVARGFNYHQGPEWLWPMGYYLAAWLHFRPDQGERAADSPDGPHHERARRMVLKRIQPHAVQLQWSDYAGLVELTNRDGSPCPDSCLTQAWSMATMLEALEMLP